jgi:transcriptional regulator with XRE-family HTH domain
LTDSASFYAEVGQRVRRARERAGLTQDARATRFSLSRTSVTNVAKGKQRISLYTLCCLAAELSVTPGSILPDVVRGSTTGT